MNPTIQTRSATPEYLDNWGVIFGKKGDKPHCLHPRIRYTGHSHNDDCYECPECGYIEWR